MIAKTVLSNRRPSVFIYSHLIGTKYFIYSPCIYYEPISHFHLQRMSQSFPPPDAKKEVPLPANSFTFGPGIADAASPMSTFRFSSNFSSTQPTSHLPPGVPPAVHQRFTFSARNSTDSPSISSTSSNGEPSMDRAPTRASTVAFPTPTMNLIAPVKIA